VGVPGAAGEAAKTQSGGTSVREVGVWTDPKEDTLTPGRSLTRFAAVAIWLMLLTGCASSPPTPVTSIDPLVGKWAGTVDQGSGSREFFYLTINADQTLVASWGINWSWGKVTVANGQATYQMTPPPYEGTLQFYQGNGKPTLFMKDLFANFYAVVTMQP